MSFPRHRRGLDTSGGAAVEKAALSGDPTSFAFTVPMWGKNYCDFSYSGNSQARGMTAMCTWINILLAQSMRCENML